MPGIYAITHKATGRAYIGSAVDIDARWRTHRSDLRLNRHYSHWLQAAWNKYGEEAFELVIIEAVPELEKLVLREQGWIDIYRAAKLAYNLRPIANSNLGTKRTKETCQKISKKLKGNRNGVGSRSNAKLSDEEALDILGRYAGGERYESIHKGYPSVSLDTVQRLVLRKTYHLLKVPPAIEAGLAKFRKISKSGSRCGKSKLTESDLPTIREMIAKNVPLPIIASIYGLTTAAIRAIRNRKVWGHVP